MPGSTVGQVYPNRPDLARAKQLVGTRGGPATFYTCNLVPCTQLAELVKQQLAPLGIDVRIEQFPVGRYLSVLGRRDAQFDIAFFGHTADSTDPGAFLEGLDLTTFFESPASERRLRAAHGVAGPARERTYSRLQLELTRDTPLVVFGVNVRQDFFSARMGCQVYNPLYGMDLAALCVKG
jgi:ABC-type transport system substrate-binding protein